MAFDFSGQNVIVTGGSSGIGAACVHAFAESGARVAIIDREPERLDSAGSTSHGDITCLLTDVRDDAAIQAGVAGLVEEWGEIHHLVNSAASFVAEGLAATRQDWETSLGVNVASSALLTARVSGHMPPGGSVVNISSISAHVAQPERWTYNATKSAIVGLTRCQAMDLAPRGIRVNAVSPGWIWTAEVEKAAGGDRASWEPVWGEYHLLRRLGEAEEVARPVLFLCSGDASFITGTELMVDGGYRAMGPEGLGSTSVFAGSAD